MNKLLDSVASGFLASIELAIQDVDCGNPETYASHRLTLELYAFLLHWFVTAAEKVKARDDGEDGASTPAPKSRRGRGGKTANARSVPKTQWTWMDQIAPTLALIGRALRLKTHRYWTTTPDRDAFIKYGC